MFDIKREDLLKWGKEIFTNWKNANPSDEVAITLPNYEEFNYLKVVEELNEVKKYVVDLNHKYNLLNTQYNELLNQMNLQTQMIHTLIAKLHSVHNTTPAEISFSSSQSSIIANIGTSSQEKPSTTGNNANDYMMRMALSNNKTSTTRHL